MLRKQKGSILMSCLVPTCLIQMRKVRILKESLPIMAIMKCSQMKQFMEKGQKRITGRGRSIFAHLARKVSAINVLTPKLSQELTEKTKWPCSVRWNYPFQSS